jgi:purine-cytosine permease-like protein
LNDIIKLELLGSVQLVVSVILVAFWSFCSSEWWSAVLLFLAVFFLVEAVWHYILGDYLRHFKHTQPKADTK